MKTIKEPIAPIAKNKDEFCYHLPCKNKSCGAVLEVEPSELMSSVIAIPLTNYAFQCPHCGQDSMFDSLLLSTFKVSRTLTYRMTGPLQDKYGLYNADGSKKEVEPTDTGLV